MKKQTLENNAMRDDTWLPPNHFDFLVCKKTYDRPFVATKLLFTPCFDHIFMVGGQDAVHIWKLNEETKKATSSIIPLGKIKRTISDMVVRYTPSYHRVFER